MAQGNQYDYVPGYDYPNNIQQMGMFYWDTGALAYVRWSGSSTTPNVAIANFPAVSTITGTVTATAPSITTVTGAVYVASVTSHQGPGGTSAWPVALATTSISGNVGVSGAVAATQSGNWAVGVTGGNVAATQSGNWAVGVTGGNIAATQSGTWNVGINSGAQIAIASGQGVGISGSVVASLSGTNYVIATLSTGSAIVGGVYPVSGLIQNERAQIVPGSISFVNATTSGHLQVIAAQGSGIFIRVLGAHVMTRDYTDVAFLSATAGFGSTITSLLPCPAYGGFVWPFNPQGWCETGSNVPLTFYQSTATNTGVQVVWATFN